VAVGAPTTAENTGAFDSRYIAGVTPDITVMVQMRIWHQRANVLTRDKSGGNIFKSLLHYSKSIVDPATQMHLPVLYNSPHFAMHCLLSS
jgi:hypothetical protein